MGFREPEAARAWMASIEADPTNYSASARAARAILEREPFDVDELARSLGTSVSTVYVVIGDMRAAGYPVEKQPESVRGGARIFRLVGGQRDEPQSAPPRPRRSAEVVHVANGGTVKLPAAFLRPPPGGLPALGEVLRVAMLAESDDGEALVLQGADGRRYFARFDTP